MIRSVFLRRLAVLPAFLLPAAAPAVHAQVAAPAAVEARTTVDPALAGIDSMLTALYPAAEPGAAVLVARDGQVLMRKAYGAASVELGVPLRPEHVFRLGSITKQFTAVATLMLVDEGKVSLDDEITRWYPDYPTQGRHITVEHLLTHTSGIQSYTGMPTYVAGMRRDLTPDELIAVFRDQPMEFAPGERWNYNNSGYALLGGIIEKVSGMSYADFIRTRIFEPLGMRHSYYETANAVIPGRVPGYDRTPDGTIRAANYLSMTQPYAAGSLISTVDDQLLWQRAVAEGRMLKPETWRRAHTAYRLSDGRSAGYGYGWFVGEAAGRPSIEHGGDINGFSSNGLWIPSERLHVIVLSNREREGERDPDDISRRIAARLLGTPAAPAFAVAPEALRDYVGVYKVNETENRVITVEDGTLYNQRGRNPRQPLTAVARDEFISPSGTRLRFLRGTDGRVTGMMARGRIGPEEPAPRTAESVEAVVAAASATVTVPVAVLQRYVGVYQLAPGFEVTVRLDGDVLRAAPTNQPESPLVPESETRFSVREANAVVDFEIDATGAVTRLILHQGGRTLPAPKIR
ncbi:MAG TPA: serine hydrolase [Longimicrobium sp.]|nr:serine hydrolase [Longimicrobium sp.]